MFPYINHLQKKKIRVLGHYICQAENLLQADVISIGKYEELLLDAFRDDIVFGEESEEGVIIDWFTTDWCITFQKLVSIQEIDIDSEEYSTYYQLTESPAKGHKVIGDGEAASISLAKKHGGIVESNNLRDIQTYQNLDSNIQLLAIFLWMLMTEDLLLKMRVTLFGPICLLNAGD